MFVTVADVGTVGGAARLDRANDTKGANRSGLA